MHPDVGGSGAARAVPAAKVPPINSRREARNPLISILLSNVWRWPLGYAVRADASTLSAPARSRGSARSEGARATSMVVLVQGAEECGERRDVGHVDADLGELGGRIP